MDLATTLQIVTGLLVIGAFVVAYMAGKTWRVTHVVLVMFNFLAMLAFFYLAARTMQTHRSWREAHRKHEAEVTRLETERTNLIDGARDENEKLIAGIRRLKHDLHKIALARGPAWQGATPLKAADPATGAVTLSIKSPDPHGIAEKAVLFAFDQRGAAQGGRYLGEFRVDKTDPKAKTVALVPNLPLTAEQLKRVVNAKLPWSLYAVMPYDRPLEREPFAETPPVALTKQDLQDFVGDKHQLRNFEYQFREIHADRVRVLDEIEKLNSRLANLAEAEQNLKKNQDARNAEQAKLQADMERFGRERQIVETYLGELKQLAARVDQQLAETKAANQKLAADLTALQLKAAEEINREAAARSLAQETAAGQPN